MSSFFKESNKLLDTYAEWIELALHKIREDQLWSRLRDDTNSIGNLCMHVSGNEHQHIASGIRGMPFTRERSAEFTTEGGMTKEEVIAKVKSVRSMCREIMNGLNDNDLDKVITIQYPPSSEAQDVHYSMLELIYHVTEHYAYHTGQIVYMAKLQQETSEHLLKWRH